MVHSFAKLERSITDAAVEIVAKAIFNGQWRANSWENTSEHFRADCRNMARAAMAAMREMTD